MPSQKESTKQLAVAIAAIAFLLTASYAVCAQENVWSNPAANAWLDGANWSRGFYPRTGTDTDGSIATFKSTTVSGNVLGIDFSTLAGNTLDLTRIDFHTTTQPLIIGNSSNTPGTLMLNHVSAVTVSGDADLSMGNAVNGGTAAMNLATTHPNAQFVVNSGGTLRLNARIVTSAAPFRAGSIDGGGGIIFSNADHETTEQTFVYGGATLSVASVANAGVASPLGKDGTIFIGERSTLRYTGSGHSTDRPIEISGFDEGSTLDASGSGLLDFTRMGTLPLTTHNGPTPNPIIRTLTGTGDGSFAPNLVNIPNIERDTQVVYGLSKTGSGTWTLKGDNTYTGGTTVAEGTLLINNTAGSGTGTGAVIVNGGTLGGTGTIGNTSGLVSVNAGATLAPGVGIGTLATNSIAFSDATSRFNPEIELSPTLSADLLNVTGSLTLTGSTLDLSLLNASILQSPLTVLVVQNDGTDPIGGIFNTINVPTGYSASVNYAYAGLDALNRVGTGNDIAVTLSMVPEPSAFAHFLTAIATFAASLRRKRHQFNSATKLR
jgi:autotransporter-associated beta strand protein